MMGRPPKEIDREEFEKLCEIQCTENEICAWFGVCEDTLNKWCKDNYLDENGKKMTFSDVFNEKRKAGLSSLRRKQWRLAEKSAAMAIFLGKNYLGQSDTVIVGTDKPVEDDPLSASLKEIARSIERSRETEE